jgi:hypothetical protein
MEDFRNTYKILIRKLKMKTPLRRLIHRWEDDNNNHNNDIIAIIVNPLKPSGCFIYHLISYTKSLHFAH